MINHFLWERRAAFQREIPFQISVQIAITRTVPNGMSDNITQLVYQKWYNVQYD